MAGCRTTRDGKPLMEIGPEYDVLPIPPGALETHPYYQQAGTVIPGSTPPYHNSKPLFPIKSISNQLHYYGNGNANILSTKFKKLVSELYTVKLYTDCFLTRAFIGDHMFVDVMFAKQYSAYVCGNP
jgi:hypothetical protein